MSDTDPRLGMGGNFPPEPIATSELALMLTPGVLRDQYELDHAKLFARTKELLEGVERFFATVKVIETIEMQARAADFVKQLDQHWRDIEFIRVGEAKPLDNAKAALQKLFKAENQDKLNASSADIKSKMTVFQRAETKRIAAERAAEEQRLADEAAAAAALAIANPDRPSLFEAAAVVAKTAERGPRKVSATVRGAASTASIRERWSFEEVDLSQIPNKYLMLNRALVQADIDNGLRDGPDGKPGIPGLRIVDVSKVVVR